MNASTTNAATNTEATVQPINENYEYIQYNQHLRLIHSIKDDMNQMQSIITACKSKKQAKDWFRNQSAQELLEEMGLGEFSQTENLYENRPNLPNELKGTYIHRLLVNHVAMWASARYSIYIMKLLDSTFERERQALMTTINEQKPRMVPENKEHSYKYLIWKEAIDDEYTILHLVRRNKKTFRAVSKFNNDEQRYYYKSNLPIAMTPNEDIKRIVKNNFRGNDYNINGCNITIKTEKLEQLHQLIEEYFNKFQS
ncbi:hypothetical protein M9Y10_027524 [Tritrichomonas musculus]|uniref:KilA-N domain-containing protein n=1 Tax=Tritrichomonas musculus TaxID=1915356 RepID=A0ABR2H5X6_9EUKA